MLTILIVIIGVLGLALLLREPEVRRWIATVLLRREGSLRAALGRFQPRDIQRQALALIKEQALVSIGYAHLPSDVTVFLNPEDLERLGAARDHVTHELAEQVSELNGQSAGGEVVFLLATRPQVKLEAAAQLSPGTVDIAPVWLEGTVAVTALQSTNDAPVATTPWLRISVDDDEPTEIVLSGSMTIGRAPTSSIPINHPSVSRNHAILAVEGESETTITDLDSRNGIEVAGMGRVRPGAPIRIRPGDVVHLSRHVRLELIQEHAEANSTARGRAGGD